MVANSICSIHFFLFDVRHIESSSPCETDRRVLDTFSQVEWKNINLHYHQYYSNKSDVINIYAIAHAAPLTLLSPHTYTQMHRAPIITTITTNRSISAIRRTYEFAATVFSCEYKEKAGRADKTVYVDYTDSSVLFPVFDASVGEKNGAKNSSAACWIDSLPIVFVSDRLVGVFARFSFSLSKSNATYCCMQDFCVGAYSVTDTSTPIFGWLNRRVSNTRKRSGKTTSPKINANKTQRSKKI